MVDDGRDIAGGEDVFMRGRVQAIGDLHEAVFVDIQPGLSKPGWGGRICHPEDLI